MKIKLAPSLASADQSRLGWAAQVAEHAAADLLHFDLEDGVFIPNLTFGPATLRDLRRVTSLPFDVHLEVVDPERYLQPVVEAGANVVTIQVEATRFPYRALAMAKRLGVRAGLAFAAATPLEMLEPVLDELDVIHLMTAEPNGGGAPFLPGLLGKIRQAKQRIGRHVIEIEVDGGISIENAARVVEAGATILVVGRAIWGAPDPATAIEALRSAAAAAGLRQT